MPLVDGVHFAVSEFACHDPDRTTYPEAFAEQWAKLVSMCDLIREQWGRPLFVVSGYRTPEHNQALMDADEQRGTHQVASSSFHMTGQAADLRPEQADQIDALLQLVLRMHADGELPMLGGVASYPVSCWLHVDTGIPADGHLRRWNGT